jgi:hypothetical protein
MHRALKLGGVYLLISHGAPNNRINHIKRYIDVDIDVMKLRECHETPFSSFMCLVIDALPLMLTTYTYSYTHILLAPPQPSRR